MNEENENFNEENSNIDETSARREENRVIVQELERRQTWYLVKIVMTIIMLFVFYWIVETVKDNSSPALYFALDTLDYNYVFIAFGVLVIYFLLRYYLIRDEINRYCPYCYEKDFERTTLKEWIVRAYNTSEKRGTKTIGEGKYARSVDNMVKVRVEDWKGTYRNECCGIVYDKEWQHKIDL